jgi:hypothetical protein
VPQDATAGIRYIDVTPAIEERVQSAIARSAFDAVRSQLQDK